MQTFKGGTSAVTMCSGKTCICTSSMLNLDNKGLVELQLISYQELRKQFSPIPNGKGILTFPQVSLQPGLAIMDAPNSSADINSRSRDNMKGTFITLD